MRLVLYRGAFYAYWRDAQGKPRRTALRTKDREAARRALIDLEAGQQGPATTAADIMGLYLADKATTRPAGAERARYAWKRLQPVFAHLRPDQINRPLCRAYAQQRRRNEASEGTIIKELACLRAALRWHDKLTPAIVELPSSPAPKSRHLSREEYRRLRESARRTPHLYLFVVLAYSTAGRASAILELTWDRIDLATGQVRLGTGEQRMKGRATVPMTENARVAIEEAQPAALSDYVIEYAGRRVRSVKKAFARTAERAGIPWCTPHVLRHTAAVHMAESRIPMSEIAQYLGHSSENVTYRVYARFSPDHLRHAAAALE